MSFDNELGRPVWENMSTSQSGVYVFIERDYYKSKRINNRYVTCHITPCIEILRKKYSCKISLKRLIKYDTM